MERLDIELVSLSDETKLFLNVRKSLVCGFFMQVAHKEGDKGGYNTVKDNQVGVIIYFSAYHSYLWMVLNSLLDCTRHVD
jgi:hypothetical protein